MEEFSPSTDTSFEIPSMIEAISSSIDDSRFNLDELESVDGNSPATESDHMEVESNWTQPVPHQYNQNYYQNYQQHQQQQHQLQQQQYQLQQQHQQFQQQQWNYQQGYTQYPPYGYMAPSPYNPYYMEPSPGNYHHNYAYNTNMMTNYEQQQHQQPQQQPYIFTGNQNAVTNPEESEYSCSICIRSFKSASNLSRHVMSKTHLKRMESKKLNSKVIIIQTQKPQVTGIGSSFTDISKDPRANDIGSSFTDISKEERTFLHRLDDYIFEFLKVYEWEKEQLRNGAKKDLALTPPLTPNSKAIEDKKNAMINDDPNANTNLVKSESVITIASSSEIMQESPLSVRSSSSVDSDVEMSDSNKIESSFVESIKETSNSVNSANYASSIVNSEVPTSSYTNSNSNHANFGNRAPNNANYHQIAYNDANYSHITSNNPNYSHNTSNHGNRTPNNANNSASSSEKFNSDNITSNNYNLSEATSNHNSARIATPNKSSPANHYQSNSISTNLTSDFSNMTNEFGCESDQLSNQSETGSEAGQSTPTYENNSNLTPNYEKYNFSNSQTNYFNSNNFTPNKQSYDNQAMTSSPCGSSSSHPASHINSNYKNSSNLTTTNVAFSPINSEIRSNNPGQNNQATTTTSTASGLRITSINPNVAAATNGTSKTPTTYTLTSSNSNVRFINASNLIGNNVKIQQISQNGIKNFRIVNNSYQALQNRVKIPHPSNVQLNSPNIEQSSPNCEQSSPRYAQSSPSYAQNSPSHHHGSPQRSKNIQSNGNQQQSAPKVVENCAESPSANAEPTFLIPNSPDDPRTPTVLIQQETGEKYEIIFSDENFGDHLS
ncbi:myb-like protein I [Chironomus tepperi]|uniref:myb-like protein I n=1 Tax=Chironomus tepperi TaxID=113505 RepID=UPI00391F5230